MQKISSYLYPNRITLLANLAGFSTEFTQVYQRNVKIYNGIDNMIEFDIKNADQKRIDLDTLSNIEMNVMDAGGQQLPNSPYTVTPLDQETLKGIARVTIPFDDIADYTDQFFKYSVTASDSEGNDVMLYCDTRFGAVGTLELVGSAMPILRDAVEYKTWTGEIDLHGDVINHSSTIPATFYEAEPTTTMDFTVHYTGFIGTIWLEGTTDSTISVESFRTRGGAIDGQTTTLASATTGTVVFTVDVNEYKYFRVNYQGDNPLTPTGKVDKVVVE